MRHHLALSKSEHIHYYVITLLPLIIRLISSSELYHFGSYRPHVSKQNDIFNASRVSKAAFSAL
jgi:hypothetical protein